MRERTVLSRSLIERLPKLRFIPSTSPVNCATDVKAAEAHGIEIAHTSYDPNPTIELTWALILAASRHLVEEAGSVHSGEWQRRVGRDLKGRTLALVGLGQIGGAVAKIGQAFGMRVISWSQNFTAEKARAFGSEAISKEALFAGADVLSIHTLLSRRNRGLVDDQAIASMKPTVWLVNTSRGAIVNEEAILSALRRQRIAGYAVDVFDEEPLPVDHPFRSLDNVLATPHLGYVSESLYRTFYGDSVRNIAEWLARDGPNQRRRDLSEQNKLAHE